MNPSEWVATDPRIASLSRQWGEHMRPRYARMASLLAMAFTPVLFLVTVLTIKWEHLAEYMVPQLALFGLGLGNYLVMRLKTARAPVFEAWALLSPLLLLFGVYGWFFVFGHEEYRTTVILCMMMIAFLGSFYLHRFWREQYIFNGFGVALLIAMVIYFGRLDSNLLVVINAHVFAGFTMWLFRRDFFSGLSSRYQALCSLLPRRLAQTVVLSGDQAPEEQFLPRTRFSVSVCSDWRGFQKLAQTLDPRELADSFQIFYDIVLRKLEEISPEGDYYFDWSADELFVLFFSEKGDPASPIDQAFAFVSALAQEIHQEANERLSFRLIYDVGVASGFGLIGLMGPKYRKKTTITAGAAGVAKRLEEEAQSLRLAGYVPETPIVVLEDQLFEVAKEHPAFAKGKWTEKRASTKDVAGERVHVWHVGPVKPVEGVGPAA